MKYVHTVLAATMLCAAAGAQAGVDFSFADPLPGKQFHNVRNSTTGIGALTYDSNVDIRFFADATSSGFGANDWQHAHMELSMSLGKATTNSGVTTAPVSGSFTIYDLSGGIRTDIIRGMSQAGAFVRIQASNTILFSSPDGFTYLAGPALSTVFPSSQQMTALEEAVFTLTNSWPVDNGALIGADGSIASFNANASFSGNAELAPKIPAPASGALMGMGLLCLGRRRR